MPPSLGRKSVWGVESQIDIKMPRCKKSFQNVTQHRDDLRQDRDDGEQGERRNRWRSLGELKLKEVSTHVVGGGN